MAKPYEGQVINSRAAYDAGLTRYFTGEPCNKGHTAERMISNGSCVECLRRARAYQRTKEWRQKHPGARTEEARKYRAAHPEVGLAAVKRYKEKNPDKVKEQSRLSKQRLRTVNPEKERARLLAFALRSSAKKEATAGRPRPKVCDICSEVGKIVYDHDHQTGLFRGWLCDRCNRTLGQIKDSPDLLRKMANYLEDSRGENHRIAA